MRTRWSGPLLGALLLALAVPARAELPKTLEELKERHAELGKTPEGALGCWFDAVYVYMNEETRDIGRQMIQFLTIPYMEQPEWDRDQNNQYFLRALTEQAYIMRSYAKGTSPENQYQMDPNNYELNIVRVNPNHPKALQVYLRSSGADTPRPVYMKKSTRSELWYVFDHANTYTGIRPPKDPNKEEFE